MSLLGPTACDLKFYDILKVPGLALSPKSIDFGDINAFPFGSLLVSFGSLMLVLGVHFPTFSVSQRSFAHVHLVFGQFVSL